MEIDPENSNAAGSLASIKDVVASNTITNSSGSGSKHILALNLAHSYLLNRSGIMEVFNHDRDKMLLNDSFAVREYLNTEYLEFDAGNSQPGDYLSVCIDEVEQIGYSCDSFYYYPESYKYQINIDLQDLDQYITDKNDLLELVSPSMDK